MSSRYVAADGLHLGVRKRAADRVNRPNLAEEHAQHIEIVHAHVGDEPAANLWIAEFEGRPERVGLGIRRPASSPCEAPPGHWGERES